MLDVKSRLRAAHARDLRAAIEGNYDSDTIFHDALAEIERLEALAARLERELAEARALPASIQEALNSGDGSYRP